MPTYPVASTDTFYTYDWPEVRSYLQDSLSELVALTTLAKYPQEGSVASTVDFIDTPLFISDLYEALSSSIVIKGDILSLSEVVLQSIITLTSSYIESKDTNNELVDVIELKDLLNIHIAYKEAIISLLNLNSESTLSSLYSIVDSLSIYSSLIAKDISRLLSGITLTTASTINKTTSEGCESVLSLEDSYLLLKTLLSEVYDNIIISLPSIDVPREYSTYALAPETKAVSTYTNYNFDGGYTTQVDTLFYNSIGIYRYGGSTDEGEVILSKLQTAALSFGKDNLKSVQSAYIGLTSSGVTILKVRVDGKGEFTYKLNKSTIGSDLQKISIGKGLVGHNFQFEFLSESDIFDIDSISFLPIFLNRKL